jgi:hypothetical protein
MLGGELASAVAPMSQVRVSGFGGLFAAGRRGGQGRWGLTAGWQRGGVARCRWRRLSRGRRAGDGRGRRGGEGEGGKEEERERR